MSLTVTCPSCGRSEPVPDQAIGKKIRCPCGVIFRARGSIEPNTPARPGPPRRRTESSDPYSLPRRSGRKPPPRVPDWSDAIVQPASDSEIDARWESLPELPARRHTGKATRGGLPPWAYAAMGAGAFVSLGLVVILFLASGSTSTRPPEPHDPLASQRQPTAAIRTEDPTAASPTLSGAANAAAAPTTRAQVAGGSLPALPRAVTSIPAGLGPDAPFDLETFFAAPPPDQNAAPLYLDALFEFDPRMAVCFPQDSETARRKQLAQARNKPLFDQSQAVMTNPASAQIATIDRLVADLDIGMRKIEEAQRRPKCVFQIGCDMTSELPHAQTAREVARLAVLRTFRNLDRGNVETPIHDLATVLRLARDLRPRGPAICQVVSGTLTSVAYTHILRPLLASPQLAEANARRVLEILVEHEAASIDGFEEGVKFDYVCVRTTMNHFRRNPREAAAAINNLNEAGPIMLNEQRMREIENEMKNMPSAKANEVHARLNQYIRDSFALKNAPVSQRFSTNLDPRRIDDGSFYSKIPFMLPHKISELAQLDARIKVQIRASECLIAIWLWNKRTHNRVSDLATVTKAAGLPRVPLDEYSGEPLQMAYVDGEPVVYSVGNDGRDDGGRIDSDFDRKPGDHLYRLPGAENKRP